MHEAFVPLVVRNNVEGRERELLERYREPTWNNPVVRFFTGAADAPQELLERRDRVWDEAGVVARMTRALREAQRDVPASLALLDAELSGAREPRGEVTFAMFCYWKGEAAFGALDGVVATEAAHAEGREVVHVTFDPETVSLEDLCRLAASFDCADHAWVKSEAHLAVARGALGEGKASRGLPQRRPAKDSDRRYHLRRSPLRHVPMTPLQSVRVNADLARGKPGKRWLSSTQLAWAQRVSAMDTGARRSLADHADGLSSTRALLEAGRALAPRTSKKGP